MRLIDADDLKKTYYRELNVEPGETGACYIAIGMFPRMIDNAKTINAEPKHGRWKQHRAKQWSGGGLTQCSCCGTGYAWGAFHEVEEFNFCPNCGARMENPAVVERERSSE